MLIGELIENGQYYEQKYANETPLIKSSNAEPITLLDMAADDQTILDDYGYKYQGMALLGRDEAFKQYDSGGEVFLLHSDNTESLLHDNERELLIEHLDRGGLAGYEKEKLRVPTIEGIESGADEAPFLLQENEPEAL